MDSQLTNLQTREKFAEFINISESSIIPCERCISRDGSIVKLDLGKKLRTWFTMTYLLDHDTIPWTHPSLNIIAKDISEQAIISAIQRLAQWFRKRSTEAHITCFTILIILIWQVYTHAAKLPNFTLCISLNTHGAWFHSPLGLSLQEKGGSPVYLAIAE